MPSFASLLEIVGRVAIVYLALVVMLRLCGKREVGQLTPLDLLGMLLLSETVSSALTGGDTSLVAALVAAATLLALAVFVSRIAFHWPAAARWLEGEAAQLVANGHPIGEAIRTERITHAELMSALRRHGVVDLRQVRGAWVEPNGEITVVPLAR
jgi:uncharacterized membrane protein YcaP (DUF421 family)